MLSERVMRYVDAVARCGSMRKAGTQLHVASSAINRQILALEEELGTRLFHRLPKGLQPTSAGEVMLDHIRQTRKSFENALDVIDQMKGLKRGEVTIAVMSGPSGSIMPLVIEAFRQDYPRVRCAVRVLSGPEIVAAVEQGEADVGIGFDLARNSRLRVSLLHRCTLGAVMRPDHPLSRRPTLQLSDCQPYSLVIADKTMAIRPYLDELAQRHAMTLDAAVQTNSIEVMRRMTMTSDLITFLTSIDILPERQEGQLTYVPFRKNTAPTQHLMLITRDRAVNPLAGLLIERCRLMLEELG